MNDIWFPVAGYEGLYESNGCGRVRSTFDFAKCGTPANYRAHLRRGEKPCRSCRQAESRRQRDRRSGGKRKEMRRDREREWLDQFQQMVIRVNEELNHRAMT